MNKSLWMFLLLLVAFLTSCRRSSSQAIHDITESHIEANVPPPNSFNGLMKRDLTTYFCRGVSDCRVEYQLLREGPTETGIAYPKFYVWAKCLVGGKVQIQGAVRSAAIDQEFKVTNFMSREEVVANPGGIGAVFPRDLAGKIEDYAKH